MRDLTVCLIWRRRHIKRNPIRLKKSFDVIVVGAGGSGLAAAYSAAEVGASVLILEKRPQPGGTTGIAVGSFTAAETSLQRVAKIDDHWQDHAEDVSKFATADLECRNNQALREFFLQHAAETLHWLQSLGISYVGPQPEPPNRVARMHNVVPGAKAYIATLQLALQKKQAKLVCQAAVESLLEQDGRVIGVSATVDGQAESFRARRGVILAGGDYANNPDMIAKYKGSQFRHIEGINPDATGEGHWLAEQVGAQLLNMDVTYGPELRFISSSRAPFQQFLPVTGIKARWLGQLVRHLPRWAMQRMIKRLLVTWQHPENALFDDGAILVNRAGERFTDETKWPSREIAVARQPAKEAFILLDGRLVNRYSQWPHFISTAPEISYAYVDDYRRLRPDVTILGNSLEEIAALPHFRHRPQALVETVNQFNAVIQTSRSDQFGRADFGHSLDSGPWVLLGPLKAYFTTTEGGAAINQRCEVLDQRGMAIPGLFAVGQNGLGGMILWGHGLHIAWAMTSGRLAGQAVMRNRTGNA